jgi:hypothetical protein
MKKILVLSVGGSAEPVINAIKNNDPYFVYFFCSSGQKGRIVPYVRINLSENIIPPKKQ